MSALKHVTEAPGLAKLIQQAELYKALHDLGRSSLPDNLAEKLVGVGIEQELLVCLVESSAWAAKLRFFEQPLLRVFQENLPHLALNQVQFKVMRMQRRELQVTRQANRPTKQIAEQMREMSKDLPEELAQAIYRLSQNTADD